MYHSTKGPGVLSGHSNFQRAWTMSTGLGAGEKAIGDISGLRSSVQRGPVPPCAEAASFAEGVSLGWQSTHAGAGPPAVPSALVICFRWQPTCQAPGAALVLWARMCGVALLAAPALKLVWCLFATGPGCLTLDG